jgi:hypothetical protein
VKIKAKRGRTFLEGLTKQVHPPNDQRQGLGNSLTATSLVAELVLIHFLGTLVFLFRKSRWPPAGKFGA